MCDLWKIFTGYARELRTKDIKRPIILVGTISILGNIWRFYFFSWNAQNSVIVFRINYFYNIKVVK